jgi:putative tricarboxylic transport membrane protein
VQFVRKVNYLVKKADQITGIIVLIFSGFVIGESWRMPQQSATFGPGVGFLPFWLGVLMAILSILLIVTAWRRPTDSTKKAILPGRQAIIAIVLVLVGLAVYILLLELLGFLVDTMLFTAFLLSVVMREKWKMTLVIASLTSIGLYVIFQKLLEVNLPKNMFGF